MSPELGDRILPDPRVREVERTLALHPPGGRLLVLAEPAEEVGRS